jgi:hypothetical protein
MPNMKNNDALKKHHFWILFGLVPLFVLIAIVMISSSVGGKVKEQQDKIQAAKTDLQSKTSPKSKGLLQEWDKVIETVDGKRGGLWKQNWDKQKDLFTWPKSTDFDNFAIEEKVDGKVDVKKVLLEDLSFGKPIPHNREQYAEFKKPEFYLAEFSTKGLTKAAPGQLGMADRIEPTEFNGGWQRHLRHVNDWGQRAMISDQIWLIMEDIWVQRSLLDAIKSVNDQMGSFQRVRYADKGDKAIDDPDSKTGPHNPLRRKFRSRTWEVSLEVAKKGNRQYLKGTLENITERLQVLGIGKTMTLRVWLDANRDQDGNIKLAPDGQPDVQGIEPVEFKIGSEFLPGKGGTKKIKDNKDGKEIEVPSNVVTMQPDESNDKDFDKYPNLIQIGTTVTEITRIEQKFDRQTVPIRRIEAMQMGKLDSRYQALGSLKSPNTETFKALAAAAAAPAATSPTLGAPPGVVAGSRPSASAGGMSDMMGNSGGGNGLSGGGPLSVVIDGNFRRYVDVTEQVRRMPVGIVVIVDQSYIQDVLLAFANSPLRFQVTQVTWSRFRGDLGLGPAGDGSSGGGAGGAYFQPGVAASGFLSGGSSDPDSYRSGMMNSMRRGMSGSQPPGAPTMPLSTPGGNMRRGLSGLGGEGAGGSGTAALGGDPEGDPFSFGGGTLTTVSEAQLTSGLVELSIYGIVSLYEKYDPAKDTTAPKEGEAKNGEAKGGEVKEGDKKEGETKDQDAPKNKGQEDPKEKKDGMTTTPTDPKKRVRRRAARTTA